VVLENNENVRTKAFWQTRKRGTRLFWQQQNKVVLVEKNETLKTKAVLRTKAELLHLKKVMWSNPELN